MYLYNIKVYYYNIKCRISFNGEIHSKKQTIFGQHTKLSYSMKFQPLKYRFTLWNSFLIGSAKFYIISTNWRVQWKKALRFFFKSELCQKCSKFCMQFCSGAWNNVPCVFLLKFASFSKYYACKNTFFQGHPLIGDLSLNKKQKKHFVSLSDEVTMIILS